MRRYLLALFFTGICLFIFSNNSSAQENIDYLIIAKSKDCDKVSLVKEFSLDNINWDEYRYRDKRNKIELENKDAFIEVFSFNEVSARKNDIEKQRFAKFEFERTHAPERKPDNVIFGKNERGELFNITRREKVGIKKIN